MKITDWAVIGITIGVICLLGDSAWKYLKFMWVDFLESPIGEAAMVRLKKSLQALRRGNNVD